MIVYTSHQLAVRPGYLHDAGLFSKLYVDFLMHHEDAKVTTVRDKAKFLTEETIQYYIKWGAEAKVDMLQQSLAQY